MLRPQDSSTRERKSLNGLWDFRLDSEGEGRGRGGWQRPALPHPKEALVA
jgi:beta-glucuronidase